MSKSLRIFFTMFFLFLFACDKKEEKVLIVGTAADYKPFTFMKGKQVVGFDMDLAQEITRRLGYKLHVKEMNFSELIPALKKNKIDFCISAITATHERARVVDFSIRYYLSKFSLLYRKDSPITSARALEGKKIGVQAGSTMENFLNERLRIIKNAKLVSFERTNLMMKDLNVGKIDCVLIELAEAKSFCVQDSNLSYSFVNMPPNITNYAIAFPKGSKLLNEFDDEMLKLKVSNVFDQLKEKWLEPAG